MEESKPSFASRLKGAGGAVLGAALGVVLWAFMDASGYFVFLAGAAIPFLAGRGMMMAGGSVDRGSFWTALAVGLPAFLLALFLSGDVAAALTQAREGWAIDPARIAFADGAAGQFVKDGLFGLAFYSLGTLDFVNVLGDRGIRLLGKGGQDRDENRTGIVKDAGPAHRV